MKPDDLNTISDTVLQAIASIRGDIDPLNTASLVPTEAFPISTAQLKAEEEFQKKSAPGELMSDGTIYLGQYTPMDNQGRSLGKLFNVFAAPEDLPETMTYLDTVKYIAILKNWNGYNGTNYPNSKEIDIALNNGSYNGGWVIPPVELLHGSDTDNKISLPDNMLAHKDTGMFNGTYTANSYNNSAWYWSSTEDCMFMPPVAAWSVCFFDNDRGWTSKNGDISNCRPIRFVEVKPANIK